MMRKLFIVIMAAWAMSACSFHEIVSNSIEYEARRGLQNAQSPKSSHPTNKQKAKEAEQLKKEGKCPACHGMGKTQDGRYTCTICNGTGKYQEKQE